MRGLMARRRPGKRKGDNPDAGLSYDNGERKPKKPKTPRGGKRRHYGD